MRNGENWRCRWQKAKQCDMANLACAALLPAKLRTIQYVAPPRFDGQVDQGQAGWWGASNDARDLNRTASDLLYTRPFYQEKKEKGRFRNLLFNSYKEEPQTLKASSVFKHGISFMQSLCYVNALEGICCYSRGFAFSGCL